MNKYSVDITSNEFDNIRQYLNDLGLSADQSELYLYLHLLGPSSVVSLSKAIGSGRTRLYPLLEKLSEKGLVVVHDKHYGTTYEALSPQSLEFLVHEHETKAIKLRNELNDIQHSITALSAGITKSSRVVEYKGVDGLKQINFNLTKADKEYRVFEVAHLDEYEVLPKSFVQRMRETYISNKLLGYDLTNNKNARFVNHQLDPEHKYQKLCYVAPDIFEIKIETYIYNDCIAYLQYEENNIFGVEIYNANLAQQQKQLFDLLWCQGTEL